MRLLYFGLFTKRFWKHTGTVLLSVFLLGLVFNSQVFHADVEASTKKTKSRNEIMADLRGWCDTIVSVESICYDGEEEIYQTKYFTGVVFWAESGGTYLLTDDDGLEYTKEELKSIQKKHSLTDNMKLQTKLEVVWGGDQRTGLSIVGESSLRNVAILKFNQNVTFTHTPVLVKDDVQVKDSVWVLRYPQSIKDNKKLSVDDVELSMTKVTKCYNLNEESYFSVDIAVDNKSTGGPVFTNDGELCGFFSKADGEFRTLTASSIARLLTTYNVGYKQSEEASKKPVITVKNIVLAVIIVILLAFYLKLRFGAPKKKKVLIGSSDGDSDACIEYPDGNRTSNIVVKNYIIGRGQDADLRIPDSKSLSRKHAEIVLENKEYYLKDLYSTNFSYVNDSQVMAGQKRKLSNGDVIRLGEVILIFRQKV